MRRLSVIDGLCDQCSTPCTCGMENCRDCGRIMVQVASATIDATGILLRMTRIENACAGIPPFVCLDCIETRLRQERKFAYNPEAGDRTVP